MAGLPTNQKMLFNNSIREDYFTHALSSIGLEIDSYTPNLFGESLSKSLRSSSFGINVLSLFSGAGGLDIGFHDAGFDVRSMVEIDERFAPTLCHNCLPDGYFGHGKVNCIDVREFKPQQQYDFIVGGPPCQTFSAAARRASGVTGVNDTERGMLFEEYVRILKKVKPKGFLFENVYGIIGANDGKAWAAVKSAFESVGYRIFHRILDAADFGVPQHRERVFIVGVRDKKQEFKFPLPTHGPDSPSKRQHFCSRQALEGLGSIEKSSKPLGGQYGHLLEGIPPGLNYSFYTSNLGHPQPVFAWRSKFSDFLYKADPNRPVRTLKAQGGQYTGPFHWHNRKFTLPELKRLQTFPDHYEILGAGTTVVHQIGNSVPSQLGRILALAVLDQVFKVDLPFDIEYLDPSQPLGFRKRKRKLSSYYQDLAQTALENNKQDVTITPVKRKRISASLTDSFSLIANKNKSELTKFEFAPLKEKWVLKAFNEQKKDSQAFCISILAKGDWGIPVKTVELNGNVCIRQQFTGLWKFLEAILAENRYKADLVQLCGYYQYEPAMEISFHSDHSSMEWSVLKLVSENIGTRQILSDTDLGYIWNISKTKVETACEFLKSLGFEVRNENTNSEIKNGCFLIPYAFPTLNSRSVQLYKSLTATSDDNR